MVPKPGEPGSETWPDDGEAWQRGGGNCWVTSTFDPDLNLLYVGTGNPCPDFDGDVRPGDNLHTDSGVAVDVDTGEIKSHFQYTPHDVWDYDSTMEHILFDLDGQKLAAHFDKNGFLYILDRTTMDPVRVAPFVDRIDWGEVDEKGNVTPKVFPDKEGDPVHFWPGPAGAKEWTHACYNPQHRAPLRAGAGRRRDGHPAAPGVQGEHPVLGSGRRRRPRRHGGVRERLRPAHRRGALALAQRHPDVRVDADDGRRPRVRGRADRRVQRARRRAAATICGSSSAAAATTAARAATASTDGSTSPCRPAGARGRKGSCPGCSGPAREARCSRSRSRSECQVSQFTNTGLRFSMGFLLLGIDSLIACLAVGALVDRQWRLRLRGAVRRRRRARVPGRRRPRLEASLRGGVRRRRDGDARVVLALYLLVVAAGTQRSARWSVWVLPFALIARQPDLRPGRRADGLGSRQARTAGAVERAARLRSACSSPSGCRGCSRRRGRTLPRRSPEPRCWSRPVRSSSSAERGLCS